MESVEVAKAVDEDVVEEDVVEVGVGVGEQVARLLVATTLSVLLLPRRVVAREVRRFWALRLRVWPGCC